MTTKETAATSETTPETVYVCGQCGATYDEPTTCANAHAPAETVAWDKAELDAKRAGDAAAAPPPAAADVMEAADALDAAAAATDATDATSTDATSTDSSKPGPDFRAIFGELEVAFLDAKQKLGL